MSRPKQTKLPQLYWDANAFLAWLKPEADRARQCGEVLTAAEQGQCSLVTSALTLTEVLNIKHRPKLGEESEALVRSFFRNPYLLVVALDRHLAEEAREFVWRDGVKPKDAIHVATAAAFGVDALHTFDKHLIKRSGLRGLTVEEPFWREPNQPSSA